MIPLPGSGLLANHERGAGSGAMAMALVCGCLAPVSGLYGGALTGPLRGKSALRRLKAIAYRPMGKASFRS
jgi:hypothetical protein